MDFTITTFLVKRLCLKYDLLVNIYTLWYYIEVHTFEGGGHDQPSPAENQIELQVEALTPEELIEILGEIKADEVSLIEMLDKFIDETPDPDPNDPEAQALHDAQMDAARRAAETQAGRADLLLQIQQMLVARLEAKRTASKPQE